MIELEKTTILKIGRKEPGILVKIWLFVTFRRYTKIEEVIVKQDNTQCGLMSTGI